MCCLNNLLSEEPGSVGFSEFKPVLFFFFSYSDWKGAPPGSWMQNAPPPQFYSLNLGTVNEEELADLNSCAGWYFLNSFAKKAKRES